MRMKKAPNAEPASSARTKYLLLSPSREWPLWLSDRRPTAKCRQACTRFPRPPRTQAFPLRHAEYDRQASRLSSSHGRNDAHLSASEGVIQQGEPSYSHDSPHSAERECTEAQGAVVEPGERHEVEDGPTGFEKKATVRTRDLFVASPPRNPAAPMLPAASKLNRGAIPITQQSPGCARAGSRLQPLFSIPVGARSFGTYLDIRLPRMPIFTSTWPKAPASSPGRARYAPYHQSHALR